MATQVAVTTKAMHELINSLRDIDSTEEQQKQILGELEVKNHESGETLRKKVEEAEARLVQVREALSIIAEDRFTFKNSTIITQDQNHAPNK